MDSLWLTDNSLRELKKLDSIPAGSKIIIIGKGNKPYLADSVNNPVPGNAMEWGGEWDANANIPDITNETKNGKIWRVKTAGNTSLGGIANWQVDDFVVKVDSGWAKINNNQVPNLYGYYDEVFIINTDLILPASASVGKKILYKTDTSGKIIVKPASSQFITIAGKTFGAGVGVELKSYGYGMAQIGFEKIAANEWKIRDLTGKCFLEGAAFWYRMQEARLIQQSNGQLAHITPEMLFRQDGYSENNDLRTVLDSAYDKSILDWNNHLFEDYSIDFQNDAYFQVNNFKKFNFISTTKQKALFDVRVKIDNLTQYANIINYMNDVNDRWSFYFNDVRQFMFDAYINGNEVLTLKVNDAVPSNIWTRLTGIRDGNQVALYIDGEQKAVGTLGNSLDWDANFYIGTNAFNQFYFQGQMQDLVGMHNIPFDIDVTTGADLPAWNYPPEWLIINK